MDSNKENLIQQNTSYLFVGVVVANIFSFLFRAILAREFGPSGFGVFSLAIMTTSIATMVALLGLPDGVVTFVSKSRSDDDYDSIAGVLLLSFSISITLAVTLAILMILFAPVIAHQIFNAPDLEDVLWWFAWIVPANVIVDLSVAYFLSIEKAIYKSIIKQILPKVLIFVSVVGIAILNGPFIAIGVAYLATMFLVSVIAAYTVISSFPIDRVQEISVSTKRLLAFSLPLLTTAAIGLLINWTDTIVIGIYMDSTAVGVYQAAFLLSTNLTIVLGSLSDALYPRFGTLYAKDDFETIKQEFMQNTSTVVLITVAPTLYLIFFPKLSLEFLFGRGFSTAVEVLIILAITNGLVVIFGPSTNLLKVVEESRYIALTYAFAAILNGVMNILLVPKMGIVGASIGASVAILSSKYLHYYRASHYIPINLPIRSIIKSITVGIIVILPSSYLSHYVDSVVIFFFHIMVFSALYLLGLILIGETTISEMRSIISGIY